MIPRRVWTFTFYYITTIHWRAPFSLCFDLRASSKISRNSMMPRFASWVSICLVIVLMIVFSHFHGHLLYIYHCVSDLEEFHWMVFSADQRFGKFLQELSSKLPPLRARSFKIEDVRKYLDHHYHYLYHCHHQQCGYGGTVEVMEEAQFPVSTNRCRSMRSLTIAETRPGA